MNFQKDLIGKTAIITGAVSGIGKAVAKKLALHGCKIIILDINDEMAEKTVFELNNITPTEYIKTDICKREDIEKTVLKIANKVDFLLNVAGISISEEKAKISEENFDKLINVNMKSVYLTTMIIGHHCLNNGGAIVNFSSIRAKTGTDSYSSSYAASKAGVENFTKSFALELAEKRIRVNAIAPGATYPTKMSENWSESLKQQISSTVPLRRLGSPEDMANAAYFLVSDLSTYITGQTINVNGGAWMS